MPQSDFYDPVYREEILKSPAGRGLFFAPDGVKRVKKTIEAILNSAELKRMHFIYEDPFCIRGFPSTNYTAYHQLAGTLYLSDLCRPKITIDGKMFYQWLLDKNLLEEYMMALLLDRMIRLPIDRVLMTGPPFEKIAKWEIINDLLHNTGKYYDAWKKKFGGNGKTNAFQTIKEHLKGDFDAKIVVDVLKPGGNPPYEIQVLKSFVCGPLNLARMDRVYRLAYASGKNYDILNIGLLFEHIEMSNENGNLKYAISDDGTLRQMFRFYSTDYEVILPEIILHEEACFYRALFRKSLAGFFEKQKKEAATILDLIFLNDYELWFKLKESGCSYVDKVFHGSEYFMHYRKENEDDSDKLDTRLSSMFLMLKEMKIKEEDVAVDVVRTNPIDQIWLSPVSFSDMKKVASDKRFTNIDHIKNNCYLSFFFLKEVDGDAVKKVIDEVFENGN